jgi:hypothetical protein
MEARDIKFYFELMKGEGWRGMQIPILPRTYIIQIYGIY